MHIADCFYGYVQHITLMQPVIDVIYMCMIQICTDYMMPYPRSKNKPPRSINGNRTGGVTDRANWMVGLSADIK